MRFALRGKVDRQMRHTDIAIVGGGLAGATAAAMLGRARIDSLLIDPHLVYPPDFRCEKLDGGQLELLRKTGLADAILPSATPDDKVWLARFGRLVDKRPTNQYDILYDALVNAMRAAIAPPCEFVRGKVAAISTSADRQTISLSNGEAISARLVVLATGLNTALRRSLGIERQELSHCHSISIGFDLKPVGRPSFDFRSLTYFPERIGNKMAYLALFPIGHTMRANYFVYRDLRDPWLTALRAAPAETISADLARLKKITGEFDVAGTIDIRPVDLYAVTGYRQSGIALVGDAFSTSCPAAGTGVSKVFTDVERLCNVHIPRWLASEGMGKEKIAAFYDDPAKQACDSMSLARAYFLRALSTDPAAAWTLRRWTRFLGHLGKGMVRAARELATLGPSRRLQPAAER
jgi:2-polyprenyl-6-methoxyphenol hydroxylase-like FAD-dependent oxidoreductase